MTVELVFKKDNVDWMIDWTNIFNTRQFVTLSYGQRVDKYKMLSAK